jgi:WD40 repeat protein/tRNA A-37 threonylcarbamoyl transferase component Bud32
MPLNSQLMDLLLRYEELREQGQHVTAEEICRDCPELLAEVKLRIQDLQALAPVLESPAAGLDHAPPPEAAAAVDRRYRPLGLHARGGLGEVYLALEEALGRKVALKRMRAQHAVNADSRRRFQREAEVTGRLEHPGVVPVYGLGQDSAGQPCYAMRFIEGETLHQAIRRCHQADPPGPALRHLLRHFVAVCNTVAYAHSRGILHRDLKPANVMLGQYGETLVVDWGLARPVERSEADRAGAEATLTPTTGDAESGTRLGQVIGTPAYMSPEQAAGRWDVLGPASDVYSLGATLYVILTGRAPFEGGTHEVLERVRRGDFPPPAQLKKGVPPALAAVCLRAMARSPEERYGSALELAGEVERWLADEPVRSHREPWRQRLARWGRRHRALLAGSVVLLVAGVLALAAGNLVIERARQDEAAQKEQARQARRDADRKARAAKEARTRAEAARKQLLRTALDGYHRWADRDLASLRLLRRAGNRADRLQEALALIKQTVALERQAGKSLRDLGGAAGRRQATEAQAWQQRRVALRTEAAHWLTTPAIGRTRSISLPPRPADVGRAVALSLQEVPELHRPHTGWLKWVGDLAVSPDGLHVALIHAGARGLLVIPAEPGEVRRLPLPAAMPAIKLGLYHDSLRFVARDRIELSTAAEVVTWTWPEGRVRHRRRPSEEAAAVRQRIQAREEEHRTAWLRVLGREEAVLARNARWSASRLIGANGSPEREQVRVREVGKPSEPRVVLETNYRVFHAEKMLFGDDPRFLYVYGNGLLAVVDVVRGLVAGEVVFERTSPWHCLNLLSCPGGVATLEASSSRERTRFRLTVWNTLSARAGKHVFPTQSPTTSLDLAGDSLVLGGGDQVVSRWQGLEPAWSAGVPWQQSQSHRDFYPWWGYAGSGGQLVLERRALLARSRSEMRTELYQPEDGRRRHLFPQTGPGRILARSPDRRFAVLVTAEQGAQATLALWSLPEDRLLGPLGTYTIHAERKQDDAGPPLSLDFSPSAQWLLLTRRPAGTVEVWALPRVRLTGTVRLPGPRIHHVFGADERRLLLAGPAYPGGRLYQKNQARQPVDPAFGQVIDLATGKRVCDLQAQPFGQSDVKWSTFRITATQVIAVRWQDLNSLPYQVSTWDLKTGQRADLAAAPGARTGPGDWMFSGYRIQLGRNDTRLLIAGYWRDKKPNRKLACVQLWDLSQGRLLAEKNFDGVTLNHSSSDQLKMAFDRDHVHLVVQVRQPEGPPKTSVCWKWADGSPGTPRNQALLAAGAGNRWALWLGTDGLILYDHASNRYLPLQETGGKYLLFRAALSPDGRTFLLENRRAESLKDGGWRNVVVRSGLWDVAAGACVLTLPRGHSFRSFDPTGRWLGSVDLVHGEVRLWDLPRRQAGRRLSLPLLVGNTESYVRHTAKHLPDLQDTDEEIHPVELALHPGGDRVAVLSQGVIELWDLRAQRRLRTIPKPGHVGPVGCVAQHAGTGVAASGGTDGVVLLWDRRDGGLRHTLPGHTGPVTGLAFSPDGTRLASASADGTIVLWDREGKRRGSCSAQGPGTAFTCLAFAPLSDRLLAGTRDGRILVFDVRQLGQMATLRTGSAAVEALAFSPNGRELAAGTADGEVYLWDARSMKARRTLRTGAAVHALVLTPGGGYVVTGGRLVQFWDVATGRQVLALDVYGGPVRSLALNRAGSELVVAPRSAAAWRLDLASLHRQLQQLGLEVPGYPFAPGR